jgi:hypothetical protein
MRGRAREIEREEKEESLQRREREVVQPPREVVRQLLVVEMVVDRPVMRVVWPMAMMEREEKNSWW